jgi:uncharacterized protein (DUF2336 family)
MPDSRQSHRAFIEVRDRMLDNPSASARAAAAAIVAAEFAAGELGQRERALAVGILERLALDVERQVRQTLAEHLRGCPALPAFLARMLAEDVEQVAIPILRFSPVLSDADLIVIVAQGSVAKQLAVAEREQVSAEVADALVATGVRAVIGHLLGNPGAELTARALHEVLDRLGGDRDIQGLMVDRPLLPLAVAERLIRTASEALCDRLVDRHGLPRELADALAAQGGEGALARQVATAASAFDGAMLAARLHADGKLSPTLLLRSLCLGDAQFFEQAMAVLARIPVENAAPLIYDPGQRGFKALYQRTPLPVELYRAFRLGVDMLAEITVARRGIWRLEHTEILLQQLAQECARGAPAQLEALVAHLSTALAARDRGNSRLH